MYKSIRDYLASIPLFTELKLRDAVLIVSYFMCRGSNCVVTREELCTQSGANPLRVDPIMFELIQRGVVIPIRNNDWGVPNAYTWVGLPILI